VDLGDAGLMRARSWTWLRARIFGLLSRPPQVVIANGQVVRLPANRLQAAFSGQPAEQHQDAEEG
jgi:hypothetical protein